MKETTMGTDSWDNRHFEDTHVYKNLVYVFYTYLTKLRKVWAGGKDLTWAHILGNNADMDKTFANLIEKLPK